MCRIISVGEQRDTYKITLRSYRFSLPHQLRRSWKTKTINSGFPTDWGRETRFLGPLQGPTPTAAAGATRKNTRCVEPTVTYHNIRYHCLMFFIFYTGVQSTERRTAAAVQSVDKDIPPPKNQPYDVKAYHTTRQKRGQDSAPDVSPVASLRPWGRRELLRLVIRPNPEVREVLRSEVVRTPDLLQVHLRPRDRTQRAQGQHRRRINPRQFILHQVIAFRAPSCSLPPPSLWCSELGLLQTGVLSYA